MLLPMMKMTMMIRVMMMLMKVTTSILYGWYFRWMGSVRSLTSIVTMTTVIPWAEERGGYNDDADDDNYDDDDFDDDNDLSTVRFQMCP